MKKLANRKLVVLAIVFGTLIMFNAIVYALDVTLDDFSLQNQTSSSTWSTGDSLPRPIDCTYTGPTAPNTIGAHRDVCIQISGASTNGDQSRLRVTSDQLALGSDSSLSITGTVQWDGPDATPNVDYTGLQTVAKPTGEDLTGGGTNDGIVVRIIDSDGVPVRITLRIFTDEFNWAEQSIDIQTVVIANSDVVDLFFPFANFHTAGGGTEVGTMDEEQVGAVEAEIVSQSPGPDLGIDIVQATSIWDFGDLPAPYPTLLTDGVNGGARHHTRTGLRLGASVDAEGDGVPNATAEGDDNAFVVSNLNDEDGVSRETGAGNPAHGGWTEGTVDPFDDDGAGMPSWNGGSLTIDISGGSGYPQLFIDFNEDGTLTPVDLRDGNGNIYSDPFSEGTHRVYFDIPSGTFNGTDPRPINARIRLSSAGGLNADGLAPDGEVEDYIWGFGPTAVNLQNFSADNTSTLPIVGMSVLTLLALVSAGIFIVRREQKQA